MNHNHSTTVCIQKSSPGDKKPILRRDNIRPKRRAYDPQDRLVRAIALQAIKDLVSEKPFPPLSLLERETAIMFVNSHRDLYLGLGIPSEKLDTLLATVPPTFPQEVTA